MCSPFIMLDSCITCLWFDFFALIIVQIHESPYDNIVKSILIRTTKDDKKVSVRNNVSQQRSLDPATMKEGLYWFTGMARSFLSSKVNRGEKQGVYGMPCFELCWARQHDKENLKICERFFWPEYCKGTISRILRLEHSFHLFTHL